MTIFFLKLIQGDVAAAAAAANVDVHSESKSLHLKKKGVAWGPFLGKFGCVSPPPFLLSSISLSPLSLSFPCLFSLPCSHTILSLSPSLHPSLCLPLPSALSLSLSLFLSPSLPLCSLSLSPSLLSLSLSLSLSLFLPISPLSHLCVCAAGPSSAARPPGSSSTSSSTPRCVCVCVCVCVCAPRCVCVCVCVLVHTRVRASLRRSQSNQPSHGSPAARAMAWPGACPQPGARAQARHALVHALSDSDRVSGRAAPPGRDSECGPPRLSPSESECGGAREGWREGASSVREGGSGRHGALKAALVSARLCVCACACECMCVCVCVCVCVCAVAVPGRRLHRRRLAAPRQHHDRHRGGFPLAHPEIDRNLTTI